MCLTFIELMMFQTNLQQMTMVQHMQRSLVEILCKYDFTPSDIRKMSKVDQ